MSARDQVVAEGKQISAGTGVGAQADPIGIEIGIRLAAEKKFTAVLVAAVTKINFICGYAFENVLDIFTPLCGVVLRTIISLFADLFDGLLFNIIRLISGLFRYDEPVESGSGVSTDKNSFINQLCSPRSDGIINGYFDGLFSTVVAAVINEFLYGVNVYFNCLVLKEKEKLIPSVTSHIICHNMSKNTNTKQNVLMKRSLIIFLNEKEKEVKIYLQMACCFFCFFFCDHYQTL